MSVGVLLLGLVIFAACCAAALRRSPPQQPRCWQPTTDGMGWQDQRHDARRAMAVYHPVAELSLLGGVPLRDVRSVSAAAGWCRSCIAVSHRPGPARGRGSAAQAMAQPAIIVADIAPHLPHHHHDGGRGSTAVGLPALFGRDTVVAPGRAAAAPSHQEVWVPDEALSQAFRLAPGAPPPGHVRGAVGRFDAPSGGAGRLARPNACAVSPKGVVAVADPGNCRVAVFSSTGAPRGAVGSCNSGPADFSAAADLCIVNSSVYVTAGGWVTQVHAPTLLGDAGEEPPPAGPVIIGGFPAAAPDGALDRLRRALTGERWHFASITAAPYGLLVSAEGPQVVVRDPAAGHAVRCRFGELRAPRGAAMLPDLSIVAAEHDRLVVYALSPS